MTGDWIVLEGEALTAWHRRVLEQLAEAGYPQAQMVVRPDGELTVGWHSSTARVPREAFEEAVALAGPQEGP